MWGLGCLLYELVALKNPFIRSGLNYYTLGKKITSCDYEPLPEWASEAVRDTGEWRGRGVSGRWCYASSM